MHQKSQKTHSKNTRFSISVQWLGTEDCQACTAAQRAEVEVLDVIHSQWRCICICYSKLCKTHNRRKEVQVTPFKGDIKINPIWRSAHVESSQRPEKNDYFRSFQPNQGQSHPLTLFIGHNKWYDSNEIKLGRKHSPDQNLSLSEVVI